jgi:hypothetical protein
MTDTDGQNTVTPEDLVSRVGPFWSAPKVRAELDLTEAMLEAMRASRRVLALETSDNTDLYPIWQFRSLSDHRAEVRPALLPLLELWHDIDPWTAAGLLCAPAPELGGRQPREVAQTDTDTTALVPFANRVRAELT